MVLLGLHPDIEPSDSGVSPGPVQSFVFFGPWSSPACLRSHLCHEKTANIPRTLGAAAGLAGHSSNVEILCDTTLPPIALATSLFRIFSRSVNIFFPILKQTVLDEILSKIYENNGKGPPSPAYELFYLVIAIAALISKRNDAYLAARACSWFGQATSSMDTYCDHSSLLENIVLLQETLLICIFLLFSPESGDLWRYLGSAIRHLFDLSHRPWVEAEEHRELLCTLTRTLYYLERYSFVPKIALLPKSTYILV